MAMRSPTSGYGNSLPSQPSSGTTSTGTGSGSGGTTSTGTGGTGGTVSTAPPPPAPAGGLGTLDIPLVPSAATPVVRGPGLAILPGWVVEVSAVPSNTKNAYVAQTSAAAQSGPRAVFAAATPARRYSISNLNELWVASDLAGEGVLVSVRRG